MRIGILGGTGPAGSGLAARLASVGYDVVLGSRSKYRAMEAVDNLLERWSDRTLTIVAADNRGAAQADVVVVATPWDGATQTAHSVQDELRGKVVVSMANALTRIGKEFQPLVPPRGSVAASIQAAVPECMVAAALHHVPAKELGDLSAPIESDVLICSDHRQAVVVAAEIVDKIPNMRPLDAGELAMATPIESFTAVLLQLNVNYKTRVAVKFTGIPDGADQGRLTPGAASAGAPSAAGAKGRSSGGPTDGGPTDGNGGGDGDNGADDAAAATPSTPAATKATSARSSSRRSAQPT